jgi:hypothetical protein
MTQPANSGDAGDADKETDDDVVDLITSIGSAAAQDLFRPSITFSSASDDALYGNVLGCTPDDVIVVGEVT